jgi:pyruvate formate lyase activating enzyme
MPDGAAALAVELMPRGNLGIAYTYNEPFIWFEYVYDTARLLRERGLKNVLVTNGTVEVEPLEELLPLVDAMNVDVKCMEDEFYRRLARGSGLAARRTVEMAFGRCHVEITNLIIPGENDSDGDFRALADWASGISPRLPVHLSRYFPAYKMQTPPTPIETLDRAYAILREKLDFVYVGNATTSHGDDTRCPKCGAVVVRRSGYEAKVVGLEGPACAACGEDPGFVR